MGVFLKFKNDFSKYSAGITKIKSEDIEHSKEKGRLVLNENPALLFEIKDFIKLSTLIAEIKITIKYHTIIGRPTIHVDYGLGFTDAATCELDQGEEQTWYGRVPLPHLARAIRLRLGTGMENSEATIEKIIVHRCPVTKLIGHFHTVNEETRDRLSIEKLRVALDHLASYDHLIRNGDEVLNHAALASSIAAGVYNLNKNDTQSDPIYTKFLEATEEITKDDVSYMQERELDFRHKYKFSILMPVYDPPLDLFIEAIDSIMAQNYVNWELCISDDASSNATVREFIMERASTDPRIKFVFRAINGHISEATNSASELATGDFIVLMDNDDVIPSHALWTVAYYIDKNPHCRMLFSDEDKLSLQGNRIQPYFKGDFDRFLLYGHNMFSHLGVYQKKLFDEVGRFRKGFEGSQDYDLTLRCMERCSPSEIFHIPHVLYHWRQTPGSTSISAGQKSYAFDAALRALNEHFVRCKYPLESVASDTPGISAVRTLPVSSAAKISVIIPTRDRISDLKSCIDSINHVGDPLVEIIIVDNGSEDEDTLRYLSSISERQSRLKVVQSESHFNFSALCNFGVSEATGDIICLLNNDTEILSQNIFARARSWLSMEDVGIVGARLLYPNGQVQHFGVITGAGEHGVAVHAYHNSNEFEHSNFSKSILLQQFSAVTAACLFVERSKYEQVGGLNEDLPIAYNDVDFCLKIRQLKLNVICDPDMKLVHKESQSRGNDSLDPDKAMRLQRDAIKMIETWGDNLIDRYYNPNFSNIDGRFNISFPPRVDLPWKLHLNPLASEIEQCKS